MADSPATSNRPQRRLALGLGLCVAVLAVVFPLMPESVRPWNFALFGAVGLFAAARVGLWPGLAIMFGSKLVSDMLNWQQHGQNPDYLPFPTVYATCVLYPLIGWLMLRRSESPSRIGLTAVGASVSFYVVSNFISWLQQVSPYGYTLEGLGNCYLAGVPFFRGTFPGDLLFTGVLFGTHAILARATEPQPVAEEVRMGEW